MGILKEKRGDGTLLIISNTSLTGDEAQQLKNEAMELIESGEKTISLDLSKTEFIDSSGIGKLLFLNKKLKTNFSIVKITQTLYDFLDSLAITKVIQITPPV